MPQRAWRAGDPSIVLAEMATGVAAVGNGMGHLKKRKMEWLHDPKIPPPDMHLDTWKRYMHPNVHSSAVYNSQANLNVHRQMNR